MTHRLTAPARPGTLFKSPSPVKRKPQRNLRERDEEHLAAIRQCPCLWCGKEPGGEAAHVRMAAASFGKPLAGIGVKPDDKFCVPLCHECHMEQHSVGELSFWTAARIAPLSVAALLYQLSPNVPAMQSACRTAILFAQSETRP